MLWERELDEISCVNWEREIMVKGREGSENMRELNIRVGEETGMADQLKRYLDRESHYGVTEKHGAREISNNP